MNKSPSCSQEYPACSTLIPCFAPPSILAMFAHAHAALYLLQE